VNLLKAGFHEGTWQHRKRGPVNLAGEDRRQMAFEEGGGMLLLGKHRFKKPVVRMRGGSGGIGGRMIHSDGDSRPRTWQARSFSPHQRGLRISWVEVDSDWIQVDSDGIQVGSDGIQVGSDGTQVGSDGIQVGSDGIQVGSDGIQVGSDSIQVGTDRIWVSTDRIRTSTDRIRASTDRIRGSTNRIRAGPHFSCHGRVRRGRVRG
jgi:hypothetical protein